MGEEYGAQLEYCVPTEQFEMFREVFAMMDIDHGGTIELDELMLALESIGLKLPKKVAKNLVEEADSDNTGDIDFAEFLQFMSSFRNVNTMINEKGVDSVTEVKAAPQESKITFVKMEFDSDTPLRIEE